jgi:hypothetical protein
MGIDFSDEPTVSILKDFHSIDGGSRFLSAAFVPVYPTTRRYVPDGRKLENVVYFVIVIYAILP